MKRIFIYLSLLAVPYLADAQDTLKLQEAVALALENNFGLKVAQNDLTTTENNATIGNAGLLPSVDFSAGANYSNTNLEVTLANQDPQTGQPIVVTADGAAANGYNAGINLNYTVFDGLGNVYNYRVLKTNANLSQEQARNLTEQTLAQVINTYYQVTRLQATEQIARKSLEVSRERVNRLRNQQEFGTANSLSVLNAEVDLNTDSVNVETAALNTANARRDLATVMGIPLNQTFALDPRVEFATNLNPQDLAEKALERNAALTTAEINQQLAELNLRVTQAGYYPRLDVSAGYAYNRNNNAPGNPVLNSTIIGLNANASLNFNIFNGLQQRTRVQNAQIAVLSSRERYQEARLQVERDLLNAVASYRNSLRIYELQQRSQDAAQLNFERTEELYRLGQATGLQFREAQLNLFQVENQLNDLTYDIKQFETELLRLSGTLME